MRTKNGPTTLKQTDVSEGDVIEIEQAIQAALDDPSSIEAIAQQSYRHQNGFVKIPPSYARQILSYPVPSLKRPYQNSPKLKNSIKT